MEAAYSGVEARARDAEARGARLEGRAALLEAERAHLGRQLRGAEERVGALAKEAAAREDKARVGQRPAPLMRRMPVFPQADDRTASFTCAAAALLHPPVQIAELKRTRAELYAKLRAAATSGAATDDARLERELARIQAAAAADLEAVKRCAAPGVWRLGFPSGGGPAAAAHTAGSCPLGARSGGASKAEWQQPRPPAAACRESSEGAARELRLMRDARDGAVDEAAR